MARRSGDYRPGSLSHRRQQGARLSSRLALAEATAARAKRPEARRRAQRRVAAARRGLREIAEREAFRARLDERGANTFDKLGVAAQRELVNVSREYPDGVLGDAPSPFEGRPDRNQLWRFIYAARLGGRGPATPRHIGSEPLGDPPDLAAD